MTSTSPIVTLLVGGPYDGEYAEIVYDFGTEIRVESPEGYWGYMLDDDEQHAHYTGHWRFKRGTDYLSVMDGEDDG